MRNKLFTVLSIIFILIAIVSIISFGYFLHKKFSKSELDKLSKSLEISGYIFTASLGSLALLKYWDSVEDKKDETNWNKYRTLHSLYNEFSNKNYHIISYLKWPHKFVEIERLCQKEAKYQPDKVNITEDEIKMLKDLNNFLNFFENLYYAKQNQVLDYKGIKTFFNYYLTLLAHTVKNANHKYFNLYIDKYFPNVHKLIDQYQHDV